MTTQFTDLNLHPQLVQAVSDLGYETPTPIQADIIPLMLDGQDVIGQAQTGTGKTAAFALPMINNITLGSGKVQGLVLAPTRELAMQVAKAVHEYGKLLNVRVLSIYGGQPYGRQISRLRKGVDIVVGTPGRMLDLIKRGSLDLSHVKVVVLDEADEMLSMGFVDDIETILDETPEDRQTTLFSATMPTPIRRLANKYLNDPQSVTIKREHMTVSTTKQQYYLVRQSDKIAALTRLFEYEDITRALVFARTRVSTGELANELSGRGFSAEVLNGDLSQDARERVLGRFRRDQVKVLVATDVAARGLDIDDISHVFNFDLPQDSEVYVHRIGRTGRAGKTGIAVSFITPKEQWQLRKIEKYTRHSIEKATLPSVEDIQAQRENKLVEDMMVWLRRDRCHREKEIVTRLVAEGNDPIEIAAAALKLARSEEKQRPIPQIRDVRMNDSRDRSYKNKNGRNDRHGGHRGQRSSGGYGNKRNNSYNKNGSDNRGSRYNNNANGGQRSYNKSSHEEGMVRLQLNVGKEHGIRPNDIVGSIAYHADIPGRVIGAIRIESQQTMVDVPEKFVGQVLDQSDSYQIHKKSVHIERA